jgi:hypothetical protein
MFLCRLDFSRIFGETRRYGLILTRVYSAIRAGTFISRFFTAASSSISKMSSHALVSDTFLLSGERLDRLRQALKVAGHQAGVAQHGGYGRHVADD